MPDPVPADPPHPPTDEADPWVLALRCISAGFVEMAGRSTLDGRRTVAKRLRAELTILESRSPAAADRSRLTAALQEVAALAAAVGEPWAHARFTALASGDQPTSEGEQEPACERCGHRTAEDHDEHGCGATFVNAFGIEEPCRCPLPGSPAEPVGEPEPEPACEPCRKGRHSECTAFGDGPVEEVDDCSCPCPWPNEGHWPTEGYGPAPSDAPAPREPGQNVHAERCGSTECPCYRDGVAGSPGSDVPADPPAAERVDLYPDLDLTCDDLPDGLPADPVAEGERERECVIGGCKRPGTSQPSGWLLCEIHGDQNPLVGSPPPPRREGDSATAHACPWRAAAEHHHDRLTHTRNSVGLTDYGRGALGAVELVLSEAKNPNHHLAPPAAAPSGEPADREGEHEYRTWSIAELDEARAEVKRLRAGIRVEVTGHKNAAIAARSYDADPGEAGVPDWAFVAEQHDLAARRLSTLAALPPIPSGDGEPDSAATADGTECSAHGQQWVTACAACTKARDRYYARTNEPRDVE